MEHESSLCFQHPQKRHKAAVVSSVILTSSFPKPKCSISKKGFSQAAKKNCTIGVQCLSKASCWQSVVGWDYLNKCRRNSIASVMHSTQSEKNSLLRNAH
eukprot:1088129-Amphidinium_carterae.1